MVEREGGKEPEGEEMSYSKDLREQAVKYRKGGHTLRETSEVFGAGETAISRWDKQYDSTGELSDQELHRQARKLPPEKLASYVSEHPDAYQREIAEVFGCSDTAVSKALKRQGITRKKRHGGIWSRSRKK